MNKFVYIGIFCILLFLPLFGQEPQYPFPQNIRYLHGFMPNKQVELTEYLANHYSSWKKEYLQECSGNLRPGVDPLTRSLVEAQGFSMVAVAYMGDKEIFDKLYNFYKSKCVNTACGLMDWSVSCSGVEKVGSATDGDIDVACALIVAHWQWPNAGYDTKAKEVIANLDRLVVTCGNLLALHPGCSYSRPWGGCDETDISYYVPSFFRYFAEFSGNDRWNKLADDTHTIRDNAAHDRTGLVPDWQSVAGRAGSGSRKGYFSFDAIRAPYKQTMDFLWHGNEKAATWAKKLTNWANTSVGVRNIVDEYDLNGTKRGENHNMAALGSMAVAAMANSQEMVDAFVDETLELGIHYWYSAYLGNLYLLALSGNMWTPEIIDEQTRTAKAPSGNSSVNNVSFPSVTVTQNRTLLISKVPETGVIKLLRLSGATLFQTTVARGTTTVTTGVSGRGCYLLLYVNTLTGQRMQRIVSLL